MSDEQKNAGTQDEPLVSDKRIARLTKSAFDLGLPGFSRYMDGDFADGTIHTVAGLGASILLGSPLGMWLAAANSISRSSSGKNLWNHFGTRKPEPGS
jgi:hypothetical protein